MEKTMSKTKAVAVSGLIIAMYVGIMYVTQSFAFGAYQIRIATCLYSLSYFFPFLIVPLGLANFLSNFLGGMGLWDIVGGTIVGILASGGVSLVRKFKLPATFIIPIIIFVPGLIVPLWLSTIIGVPYPILVLSLCIGQVFPAIVGYVLVKILPRLPLYKN